MPAATTLNSTQRAEVASKLADMLFADKPADLTTTQLVEFVTSCDEWIESHKGDFAAAMPQAYLTTQGVIGLQKGFALIVKTRQGL